MWMAVEPLAPKQMSSSFNAIRERMTLLARPRQTVFSTTLVTTPSIEGGEVWVLRLAPEDAGIVLVVVGRWTIFGGA